MAFAHSGAVRGVEGALAMASTHLATSRWANVAARRPHESTLAVTLGGLADGVERTHTTPAAHLAVLAGRARGGTVSAEESLLTHALHVLLGGGNAITLARAHSLLARWARLLTGATTEALLTEALGGEALALLVADHHAPTLGRAAVGGRPAGALKLTGRALEALLTLADGLAIDEGTFTLSRTGNAVLLRAGGSTSLTEIARGARTFGFLVTSLARSVAVASNPATTLLAPRAVMLASATSESTVALAGGIATRSITLTMAIANIAVRAGRTLGTTIATRETLLADALGRFGLLVHEAGTIAVADIALATLGTLSGALLAHETLLASANSGALAGVLLAGTATLATTHAAEGVLCTAEATVTAHETFLAKALPTIGASRHTLTLAGANAALAVLRASGFALGTEETLFALTEGDLLHLIVQALTVAGADATGGGARAARVAGSTLPGTQTFALGLTKLVEGTLTVLAANLLAEALGARLGAITTDGAALALAAGLLSFVIEETSTSARAAYLTTIDETWALHHTLGPSAPTSAGALGGVAGTLAASEEGRQALHEGGVLAELVEAGATRATDVGVVANVKVIAIVANETLWLVERLESDVPLVGETRAHAVGRSAEGGPLRLRKVHPAALVNEVVTLPVGRLKRHALWVTLEGPRAATGAGGTERAADLPHNVPLVVVARGSGHLGAVPHMPNVMRRLVKLKGAARGR